VVAAAGHLAGDSLSEAFSVGGVAVLLCCTVLGLVVMWYGPKPVYVVPVAGASVYPHRCRLRPALGHASTGLVLRRNQTKMESLAASKPETGTPRLMSWRDGTRSQLIQPGSELPMYEGWEEWPTRAKRRIATGASIRGLRARASASATSGTPASQDS
jgi:hypothetical protein